MPLYTFLTSTYARNIYMTGTARFSTIDQNYIQAVKECAARKYYIDDIQFALSQVWISQMECEETLSLKTPLDPQYRPIYLTIDAPGSEEI